MGGKVKLVYNAVVGKIFIEGQPREKLVTEILRDGEFIAAGFAFLTPAIEVVDGRVSISPQKKVLDFLRQPVKIRDPRGNQHIRVTRRIAPGLPKVRVRIPLDSFTSDEEVLYPFAASTIGAISI